MIEICINVRKSQRINNKGLLKKETPVRVKSKSYLLIPDMAHSLQLNHLISCISYSCTIHYYTAQLLRKGKLAIPESLWGKNPGPAFLALFSLRSKRPGGLLGGECASELLRWDLAGYDPYGLLHWGHYFFIGCLIRDCPQSLVPWVTSQHGECILPSYQFSQKGL